VQTTTTAKTQASDFITLRQYAARLQISQATAARHVREGLVRSVKFGRLRRIPTSEVQRLAAAAS
jgi:excisionase family DNA binding protein